MEIIEGKSLVDGSAGGEMLYSDVPLSFMGGVDSATGVVTDVHHPLRGECLAGKILAIPGSRGSCAGSGVMFELLLAGKAPAGLLTAHDEKIITLGVVIADELFNHSIPVVNLGSNFALLRGQEVAYIHGSEVHEAPFEDARSQIGERLDESDLEQGFELNDRDQQMLSGADGPANRAAMRIILRAAKLEGATQLIDITQAHIDGCFYTGPGGIAFVRKLVALGAKVKVPSTMNALSVDRRRWRELGVDTHLGEAGSEMGEAYVKMGVRPTYTCAPYLLESAPTFGQQIVWAESNAVVYANSVIGARTMKYPDYLDICIAMTGRAPLMDCHLDVNRLATLVINLPDNIVETIDDSFYPTLGYLVGKLAANQIPIVCGLANADVSSDDLKAFGAAFATTSGASMFHVLGITPEARSFEQAVGEDPSLTRLHVSLDDLRGAWAELNAGTSGKVDYVALGNPHFSLTELEKLEKLCEGKGTKAVIPLVVTCGREVFSKADAIGIPKRLEKFGVSFINDTCWCLIQEPVLPREARNIMTNSAKYAHYGPAVTGRNLYFRSLSGCVDAAWSGELTPLPKWVS
jgi:predicted aconitase/predicted aconitase with swiveling domain